MPCHEAWAFPGWLSGQRPIVVPADFSARIEAAEGFRLDGRFGGG